MDNDKKFDVICLGRVAVDLYADQIGAPLEAVQSFSKYLGGSSGNIAFGTSRQGLRSSMLARVGDDHFGRFLKNQLEEVGVDTSHITVDPSRLTALVLLGIKDTDTFPLIFYRENCADMAISSSDFDEAYIASSKSLLITGTHFSTPETAATCRQAIAYAQKNSVKVILDIDYRPTLWGLTSLADGENRFIKSYEVSSHLLSIFPLCDLIVGTEEEFMIGGGESEIISCLKKIREVSAATLVFKRGAHGNSVLDAEIPDTLEQVPLFQGVRVSVLNVLGAGDAFMSGFLRGWLNDESYERCSAYANACGALVVSRHGCAPAIPSKTEVDYYLEHASEIPYPDQDDYLNHLHKVTTRKIKSDFWQDLKILAFDHRIQFEELMDECGISTDKQSEKITTLKILIGGVIKKFREETDEQIGVLVDGRYGQDLLNDLTGLGIWIARPVETPKSYPVTFEPSPDIGTEIITWPEEQIIKCLIFCHPNDSETIWERQEEKIKQLYDASLKTGNELLLEIIIEPKNSNDNDLSKIIERIYKLGVKPDWWKLFPTSSEEWNGLSNLIEQYDPYCRGILLLGLNSDVDTLKQQFQMARQFSWCKGFAIGRSIFYEPARQWTIGKIDDQDFCKQIKLNYFELIEIWNHSKI